MPHNHAAVTEQRSGIDSSHIAATACSGSIHGILKTPRSGLTSAAATAGSPAGPSGPPDIDSFFLEVESGPGDSTARDARIRTSQSSSNGSKQQKRALFIDPVCQPDSNGLPSHSLLTSSLYGPDSTAAHGHGAAAGRGVYRASLLEASSSAPLSARSKQQQRSSFSDAGHAHGSASGTSLPAAGHSSKLGSRRSSLQLPETPGIHHSSSGSPWGKPSSSGNSFNCGIPQASSGAGHSTDDGAGHAGNSGGGGVSSSTAAKLYGTAWYLKTKDWDHVTHKLEHGSTWRRESVYIQELDEQQRFAQQLEQLTDPKSFSSSTGGLTSPAGPPITALAAVMQGLYSPAGSQTLSATSPDVLAANTWAMPKKGILDEAAADAVVQHYRQLHEAAQQQAVINEKVRGTYALRAYKEYMQSKGFRPAASLQRIPTPTDEDMRRVKVNEQQQLKRQQQQRTRKHQQQQGSQLQQQVHHQQQQQGQAAGSTAAGGVSAAATAIPAASGTLNEAAVGSKGPSSDANVALSSNKAVTAPGTPGTSITGSAAAAVPRLNLEEVSRVTKQLSELKHSCHPESGLDASDWQLLGALLTGGRQAMLTAKAAASSSSGGGGAATRRVIISSSGESSTHRSSSMPGVAGNGSASHRLTNTPGVILSSRDGSSGQYGGGSSTHQLVTPPTSKEQWRLSYSNSADGHARASSSSSAMGSQPRSSGGSSRGSSGGGQVQHDLGQLGAGGPSAKQDVLHSSRPGTSSMFGGCYLTDRVTRSAHSPRATAATAGGARTAASTAVSGRQALQPVLNSSNHSDLGGVEAHSAGAAVRNAAEQQQVHQHQVQQQQQQTAGSFGDFFLATPAAQQGDSSSSSSDSQHRQHQRQQQQQPTVAAGPEQDTDDFDPDSIDLQDSHAGLQPPPKHSVSTNSCTRTPTAFAGSTGDGGAMAVAGHNILPVDRLAQSADDRETAAAASSADFGASSSFQQSPDRQLSPRLNSSRSPDSRDSPRLTSRGGAGRLSPYISSLVGQVPVHINYTLTRGGSGPITARTASPTRLSGAGNTPRSARGCS